MPSFAYLELRLWVGTVSGIILSLRGHFVTSGDILIVTTIMRDYSGCPVDRE
jgi:hypothetical protein